LWISDILVEAYGVHDGQAQAEQHAGSQEEVRPKPSSPGCAQRWRAQRAGERQRETGQRVHCPARQAGQPGIGSAARRRYQPHRQRARQHGDHGAGEGVATPHHSSK
jgi:hypothetical protein